MGMGLSKIVCLRRTIRLFFFYTIKHKSCKQQMTSFDLWENKT